MDAKRPELAAVKRQAGGVGDQPTLRTRLRALYYGDSPGAVRFRTVWVLIDITVIGFFMVAPVFRAEAWFLPANYALAAVLAVDLGVRTWAYPRPRHFLLRPTTWLDGLILLTLLFPEQLFGLGFLRALRLWTLVNSEAFWDTVLRRFDDTRVEEVTRAIAALVTFVFVTTGFVYTFYAGEVDGPVGWVDSLYFTMTTLTTTGYGDVTLPGNGGKLLSVAIMVTGVTLFLRLAQAVVAPGRNHVACGSCALDRHEGDAAHCRRCGERLPPGKP